MPRRSVEGGHGPDRHTNDARGQGSMQEVQDRHLGGAEVSDTVNCRSGRASMSELRGGIVVQRGGLLYGCIAEVTDIHRA